MVAEVDAATALVVTVNGALVAPAGTVTLAGSVAAAVLPLDSETWAPPAGRGPPSVPVPAAGPWAAGCVAARQLDWRPPGGRRPARGQGTGGEFPADDARRADRERHQGDRRGACGTEQHRDIGRIIVGRDQILH